MIRTANTARILVASFYNRLAFVGADPTSAQRQALLDLVLGLDDIGLDRFIRVLPFVGGMAQAHALELFGNDVTWGGTVTHDANGSRGDGSTGFGLLPCDCQAEFGDTNASASAYIKAMTDTGGTSANVFGSFQASPSRRFYMGNFMNSLSWAPLVESFTTDMVPTSSSPGTVEPKFLAGSLRAAKEVEGYENGSPIGTVTATGTNPGGTYVGLFCARNNSGPSNSTHSDAQLAFLHLGLALSDAQHAALYSVVQAYQTALGRAI